MRWASRGACRYPTLGARVQAMKARFARLRKVRSPRDLWEFVVHNKGGSQEKQQSEQQSEQRDQQNHGVMFNIFNLVF
jgi:hypothetical protein